MERYKHIGEGKLDRRQFIKKAAHLGAAVGAAGFFGWNIYDINRKQEKELADIRKTYPSYKKELINKSQIKVDQYKACEERTNNRCHVLMPTEELKEVREALKIVNSQKAQEEEVAKRIRHNNEMQLKSLMVTGAALVEASISGKALIDIVDGKIKRKIMQSLGG